MERTLLTPAGNATSDRAQAVTGSHPVNNPPGSQPVRGAEAVPKPKSFPRCPVINKNGVQCKGKVFDGHELCVLHEYREKVQSESS